MSDRKALTTDLIGAHYLSERAGISSELLENKLDKGEVKKLSEEFEWERVECKGKLPDNHDIRMEIVALGNNKGGYYI